MLGRLFHSRSQSNLQDLGSSQYPVSQPHSLNSSNLYYPTTSTSSSATQPLLSSSPQSLASGGGLGGGINATAISQRLEQFCDSNTRSLLYGTNEPLLAEDSNLDNSAFRIIVIQDASIRSKTALYDSAAQIQQPVLAAAQAQVPTKQKQSASVPKNVSKSHQNLCRLHHHHSSTTTATINSQNQLTAKLDNSKYHTVLELADYMFGCGVPITEASISTKLHVLPSLPKTPSSILITRLFSLNSSFAKTHVMNNADNFDSDWTPFSTLPLPQSSSNAKDLTRFGIGMVIPVQSFEMSEAITNNWEEFINFIAIYQNLLISKLKLQSTIDQTGAINLGNASSLSRHYNDKDTLSSSSSSSSKKRLSFNSYALQNDYELKMFLTHLIKLTVSLYQIPRLLVGVRHSDLVLVNWCHHVASWLEFKDGKNMPMMSSKIHFLASLFAVLIPIRRSLLTNKPTDKTKKITRVVIMTGNPAVVQKLIFIISGILAEDVLLEVQQTEESDRPATTTRSISINRKNKSNGAQLAENGVEQKQAQASIRDQDQEQKSVSPTTPSLKSSFSKGWEIPKKNVPSIPINSMTTATPVNFSPQKLSRPDSMTSSSPSNPIQQLSSSLSSSYQSSSWKQMSFMDKWWSSNNAIAQPPSTNDSSQLDRAHAKSFSSLKTPSPAIERDDYTWLTNGNNIVNDNGANSSSGTLGTNGHGNRSRMSNLTSIINGQTTAMGNAPHSPKPLARTASTFDLSILPNGTNGKFNPTTKMNPVKRTATALKGSSTGAAILAQECHDILNNDPEVHSTDMVVDLPKSSSLHNESKSFDQPLKPLVGYLDEFYPEFSLQACPIKTGLDQEIINTMKKDLTNHKFLKMPGARTVSRTIFVSLAAREIKEFKIRTMGTNAALSPSSQHHHHSYGAHSQLAQQLSYDHQQQQQQAPDVVTVEKIFSPRGANQIDSRHITKIDNLLDCIVEVARSISGETTNKKNKNSFEDKNDEENQLKIAKIRGLLEDMFLV